MTYHIRIFFRWHGELLHEFVGPFHDRWAAECVTEGFAHNGYLYGIERVRVESARIVVTP